MWYFLPFQVNTSYATFKLFKSYHLLFVSMFYSSWRSMCCFIFQPCQLLTEFHQWTSGIYICLSNNFAKRAGSRVPSPKLITTLTINSLHILPWFLSKQYRHSSMVCDCWKAPEDSVGHGLCKKGGEECQPMCKPKRARDDLPCW